MSIHSAVTAIVAQRLTSEAREAKRRAAAEKARQAAGAAHVVDVFIDPADPYSLLLAQLMPRFAARYAVTLRHHIVPPPADGAAPDRERLASWSLTDTAMLAARAGLNAPGAALPPADAVAAAARRLAGAIDAPDAADRVATILSALWRGAALPDGADGNATAAMAAGAKALTAAGHYLGGVTAYGGETYWGIDRLHYLETRLSALGLRQDAGDAPFYPPPPDMAGPVVARADGLPRPAIHWYLSFRSPYTWLSAPRVAAMAAAHGADLHLRFVLPMVMRALPVPIEKRRYIMMDTAREARRLAIPFGKVADPVGKPVERGYALLPHAMAAGRGLDFATAFLGGVWSQGIDAGSDRGMARIVRAAGLDWKAMKPHLADTGWQAVAEANRAELLSLGLWGVPSFRVEGGGRDIAVWGQDRLWAIDAALRDGR